MDDDRIEPEAGDETSADEARREALKRLGIMGAYTAPAMLMLLHGKAAASSGFLTSGVTN